MRVKFLGVVALSATAMACGGGSSGSDPQPIIVVEPVVVTNPVGTPTNGPVVVTDPVNMPADDPAEPAVLQPAPIPGDCVDTSPIGDGFGWNGVDTCTLAVVTQPPEPAPLPLPEPPPAPTPMDIDWSWALDQWFGCRVIDNDTGNRWAWKLNADGLMVDQFNTTFGAWTETDYNGERVVLFLDQGGRQDPTDIWINENSFRLHNVGNANAWGICSKIVDPIAWLETVEPNAVNNRPHSRFDNTRWYCSIRVGPTWVEGYTIELHRNGDVIGFEQRFDSRWRPFGTQGSPRYFATWESFDNDTGVRSDFYGLLEWNSNNDTLESGPDTFRCRLPSYFGAGSLHPTNTI